MLCFFINALAFENALLASFSLLARSARTISFFSLMIALSFSFMVKIHSLIILDSYILRGKYLNIQEIVNLL